MDIKNNVSLANYSTMGLGGAARYLVEISEHSQVEQAVQWAANQNVELVVIGEGSNIIWGDAGYPGLVVVNKIRGYEVYDEDETNTYLTIGAGEPWDDIVEKTVSSGLTGIEALSLIPGTAGATPIQNVGAYGQEIAQTLATLTAYDRTFSQFETIPVSDCGFGYRTSRFKTTDKGRFIITSITLHLTKANPLPPFYPAVENYLEENNISEYTPASIRQAVIAIRTAKLPDPLIVHNTGSFFANPIVADWEYAQIQEKFDSPVPHWTVDKQNVKLSAAWLIEQAGFKDYHDKATGMATWHAQPLVLVNENAGSTANLLLFKKKIVDAVKEKFGVILVQEPEMLS